MEKLYEEDGVMASEPIEAGYVVRVNGKRNDPFRSITGDDLLARLGVSLKKLFFNI